MAKTNENSLTRRAAVIEALRSKDPHQDLFMPLCFFDYFVDLPGYSDTSGEMKQDPETGQWSCGELEYRQSFYADMGAVFMEWCCGRAYRADLDPSVKISTELDGRTGVEIYETPVGSARQVWERWPEYNAGYVVEPMVKNEDDLRVARYMVEARKVVPTPDAARNWLEIVGEAGVGMQIGCEVPFHMLMYMFGPETFLVMTADGLSADIEELMTIIHKESLEKASAIAESPIQVVNHQSCWDLGIISPAIMREHYVPYIRDYTDILHSTGTLSGDHISGEDILPFADAFEATQMDFLYGINLTPSAAPRLCDLVDRWQGRLALCLGVDPMALWYDDASKTKHDLKQIRELFGDRRCVFGTADAAVAGTPAEKLRMARDVLVRP